MNPLDLKRGDTLTIFGENDVFSPQVIMVDKEAAEIAIFYHGDVYVWSVSHFDTLEWNAVPALETPNEFKAPGLGDEDEDR